MTEDTTSATTEQGLPQTPAARRAASRRAKAQKTREWRMERKAAGWPEARKVDAALAEGITFCLQPAFAITDGAEVHISMERLFRVAALSLTADGYDRDLVQEAIRERLAPRPKHDQLGSVPSLHMHMPDYRPLDRRGGLKWSVKDLIAMRAAAVPRA